MAKKILIIDDEELIIRSLSNLLEKNGYNVFVAKTGQDAIVMNEEENFDLIIADVRMPGMNGIDTVKGIHDILQAKQVAKPPVIFITGYADDKIEEESRELTPIAYIYKPFDMSELVGKIKEVLE